MDFELGEILVTRLGEILVTRNVYDMMKTDKVFRKEVYDSLEKYKSGDWGDVSGRSRQQNRLNVRNGVNGFHGTYDITKRIWILTNNDRSKTTIIFQDEDSKTYALKRAGII